MERMTEKRLEDLVANANDLLGFKDAGATPYGEKFIGALQLYGAYGGWGVNRLLSAGGGVDSLLGAPSTANETAHWLRGCMAGIRLSGQRRLSHRKNAAEPGIRPYGPGKFDHVIDGYIYELMLEGWASEDLSHEAWGAAAVVPLGQDAVDAIQKEHPDTTPEERKLVKNAAGAILYENDQGFVQVTIFDVKKDLDEEWQKLSEDYDDFMREAEEDFPDEGDDEPEEED